ncbi:MAG: Wzz/FepE/Etk N-terminal domain-containing protein [Candidatus Sulfomarinibacteraceae bacterium]
MTTPERHDLDAAEVVRSLVRGRLWIGACLLIATAVTAGILITLPPRYQSAVKLYVPSHGDPLLARNGLRLTVGDLIPLLMSPDAPRVAAAFSTTPAVADGDGWTADQVTAVAGDDGTVFIIARDEDPDLAAACADAVEEAARQIRREELRDDLAEVLRRLESDHDDLLGDIERLSRIGDVGGPNEGPVGELLRTVRLETTLDRLLALEDEIAGIRRLETAPPADWVVIERASPRQHLLRERNTTRALVAVLLPTLLTAIAWLVHDRRSRRG